MTETLQDFAARLVAGHDGGPLVESFPAHLVPTDRRGIFAIQDAIIAHTGPVGGWKVMAGGQGEPMCSPIPANRYYVDGESISSTHHRFVLAEIEVAVKLGRDLPANADTAAVEAAIASIHPAIEMVGSPFVDRDTIDSLAKNGDLQSNGAVIVGPALDNAIKADLVTLKVSLRLDGVEAKSTDTGANWAAIVEAVRWLSGHAAARGLPLQAGQVIITGARALAPHAPALLIEGDMGQWGKVTARMTY
ncbi:MAG: Fumarylacetoacetate hydrolase family protein [Devosia sp.]|nr:Fumarylacetoacetate hydrolase family protein [Devosia sp.]